MKNLKPIATDFHGFARIVLFVLFFSGVAVSQFRENADDRAPATVIFTNAHVYPAIALSEIVKGKQEPGQQIAPLPDTQCYTRAELSHTVKGKTKFDWSKVAIAVPNLTVGPKMPQPTGHPAGCGGIT